MSKYGSRLFNARKQRPVSQGQDNIPAPRNSVHFNGGDVTISQFNNGGAATQNVVAPKLKFGTEIRSVSAGGRIEPALDVELQAICDRNNWSFSDGIHQAALLYVKLDQHRVDYMKLLRHIDKIAPMIEAMK